MEMKKPTRKPERFMMRITKGAMQPADKYTVDRLKHKGYRVGDLVAITIRKTRRYWHHKKAHKFCTLITKNIPGFENLDAHTCLKRLQLESDAYCDNIKLIMPGIGPVDYRLPISISFESMDQGEFEDFYKQLCQHVIDKYWPNCSPEQIEQMEDFIDD